MKKVIKFTIIIFILSVLLIIYYPYIELYNDDYWYMMSYSKNWEDSEDLKELEQEFCYDESYSYNKKRDISTKDWEYKGILFFKYFKIKYEKGNICATEYLLEESYIIEVIDKAEIVENDDNIKLSKLIEGKKAIVKNKRYPWNDNHKYIGYKLDGEYKEMYIYTNEDGLIIIQVGNSDEGPKYIAYK